ncbi:hypothetical protein VB834_15240 [Limnoraphis robusta Tam1]|uniref:Uncharacterized protein n=1 Tax=Limnoraphis robusta CCNP1315 TaxID=3110306 RepID=A0ABU5U3C4_9CYAN|nr:hypothetical protein [Limnoraphis robusta]MEA5498355.1 hypothetical protein [Limnoraphis robusta BA-68 BA1]MEA5521614.1 hypothetical protein [Limnoraphis robusta CCNP1315]MEA5540379.1 hypothetical protein [Limnoraphis robusta Tam1]MEA5545202.1 hypothetical protein [Limnoraphis robusta CCNP1324]
MHKLLNGKLTGKNRAINWYLARFNWKKIAQREAVLLSLACGMVLLIAARHLVRLTKRLILLFARFVLSPIIRFCSGFLGWAWTASLTLENIRLW